METNLVNTIKKEKTFIIIKPDAVQRTLIGEVIQRFERSGLKLVALKTIIPSTDLVEKHYTIDSEWIRKVGQKSIDGYIAKNIKPPSIDPIELGNKVLRRMTKYMTSGPIIIMVWEGAHAVGIVRKIIGGTEPLTSDVGTIRGDFVLDSYQVAEIDDRAVRNLVHASGSVEEAEQEIKIWFKPEEILDYRIIHEEILYDINLDGILE
jgi:nucleoside-diphosphate kinase